MIMDPSYFEGPNDLPDCPSDGRDDTEQLGRRRSKRELRELARLLADASDTPEGEVLHDPDSVPLVRSKRDSALAILGLDPDSLHPCCDWCEMEVRNGFEPEQRGRWWMHVDCYVDAESHGLASLQKPPAEWAWDLLSPALNCELRHKPRPAALTPEQIRTIAELKKDQGLTQTQIAERMGCNQSTVQRALRKAEALGMINDGLNREQLKIDWFGEDSAA